MRDGTDDRLRKAKRPLTRLAIRLGAVHSVLDELLAMPFGPPFACRSRQPMRAPDVAEELLSVAADLEDSIRALREEREMAVRQGQDWARRAELATASGRPDHARQARVRQREHEATIQGNEKEIACLEAELDRCLMAVRRVAGTASGRAR